MDKNADVRLFQNFRRLVKEKQTTNFSVSYLCKEANVHHQSFYYHFHSKEEFLYLFIVKFITSNLKIKEKPSLVDYECFLSSLSDIVNNNKTFVRNILMSERYKEDILKDILFYLRTESLLFKEKSQEKQNVFFGFILSFCFTRTFTFEIASPKKVAKALFFLMEEEY